MGKHVAERFGVMFGNDRVLIFGNMDSAEKADNFGKAECGFESYRVVQITD